MKFKKLSGIAAVAIFCAGQAFCMNSRPTSIKFSPLKSREEMAWSLGVAGVIGYIASALSSYAPESLIGDGVSTQAKWGIAAFGLIGKLAYDYWSTPNDLMDAIEHHPNVISAHAEAAKIPIFEQLKKNDDDFEAVAKMARSLQSQHGTFLLGECTTEGWGKCFLSRTYDPSFRETLETMASQELIKKIKSSQGEEVQYVGFGSGGGLTDMRIIVKALRDHPKAKIAIHLIDPKFQRISLYNNHKFKSHEVTQCEDVTTIIKTLVDYVREDFPDVKEYKDIPQDIKGQVRVAVNSIIMQQVQSDAFLSTLRTYFPSATIKLFCYTSAFEYTESISNHKLPWPDVIASADVCDESCRYAPYAYAHLCLEAMKGNKNSTNFCLTKGWNDESSEMSAVIMQIAPMQVSDEYEKDTIHYPCAHMMENAPQPIEGWFRMKTLKSVKF